MTVFREVIASFPGVFRSKWSDLPLFQAPPMLVDANTELEFGVEMGRLDELAQELESAADSVIRDLGEWFWSHELNAAMARLVKLWAVIDDEFTIGDQPSFPSFQDIWDAAGNGQLMAFLEAS